jgi:S-adenosylmethionine decarboxylase
VTSWPSHHNINELTHEPIDHFITKNGVTYAGDHIIIDLFGASRIDDLALMEATLREAVNEIKATLLHIHLHHFQPNGGISGVAVLAESHISVHSWPEKGYAAFDVFSCGDSMPEKAVDVLKAAFSPIKTVVSALQRGSAIE